MRLSVDPSVNVCASSCQNVEPQLNGPASFAAGESNASVVPKLTPSAPSPASPTVRTEKSAWLRYTSIRMGGGGTYGYFAAYFAYARSARSFKYTERIGDSSFSIMNWKCSLDVMS